METEILYQILIFVGIIAVILLSLILWRLYSILRKLDNTVSIADKRIREMDSYLSNIQRLTGSYLDAIKSFLLSFETLKFIKDKVHEINKATKKEGVENDQR